MQDAGISVAVGTQALNLATAYYPPLVSHADAMRRERNRIQDELETVSYQLQQKRHKAHRLKQALRAAQQFPQTHQYKSCQLRKRLRAILAVLKHPQAKDTTKLRRIVQLVTGALAEEDKPTQEALT